MVKVLFIHPDLGIGGAERLVVDAAIGLKRRNHSVIVYTSHHEASRSFPETKEFKVIVAGDIKHFSFLNGKFYLLVAYLRNIFLVTKILFQDKEPADVFFIDQISLCIPLLKLFRPRTKVVFYCHFPDKLLSKRDSLLKYLYRIPLDLVEEWTTAFSDVILVNSKFTRNVFKKAFPSIRALPIVLYPGISIPKSIVECALHFRKHLFLSINRFEDKKNVVLCIHAFKEFQKNNNTDKEAQLVIAGGYDSRNKENVKNLESLKQLAKDNQLTYYEGIISSNDLSEWDIVFMKNISDEVKDFLIRKCDALIYTPREEHFGIVPIEAMARKCIVIGMDSGGPKETVVHEVTGFLLEESSSIPLKTQLSSTLTRIINLQEETRNQMKDNAYNRVLDNFTLETFINQLESIVSDTMIKTSSGLYYHVLILISLSIIMISYYLYFESK